MSGPSEKEVLDAVIAAGQALRRRIELADIEKFIALQKDVLGPVKITNVADDSKVGASSGIVVFSAEYDNGAGRKEHRLVLRHAPDADDQLWVEYDMGHQARVQQALQVTGLPVPEPVFVDEDGSQLGVQGYIMTAVSGEAPSPSAFVQGPIAEATPDQREKMIDQVLSSLVKIHSLDISSSDFQAFEMKAPGETALEKCINWYWATWEWIRLPDYERLKPVHQYLIGNAPEGGETLIHGDSSLHNFMFSGGKLSGILDFEMACICRPEADLALQLVGNKLFAAPVESGMLQPPSDEEWLRRYAAAGGRKLESMDYFQRFAAYMIIIAVMSLQRGMSDEMRAEQREFVEKIWTVAEGN